MCQFFSFVSNGKGLYFYLDWQQRKAMLQDEDNGPDSHSYIAKYFQDRGEIAIGPKAEDRFNKYEYNPLSKVFTVDQINSEHDDRESAEKWVRALDFKTIIEPADFSKSIINPFTDVPAVTSVTAEHIRMLEDWIKVRDSVRDSVRAQITTIIRVDKWVGVDAEPGVNPFQSTIDLWNVGLVPSFDGEVWRLHSGSDAKVVYTWVPGND